MGTFISLPYIEENRWNAPNVWADGVFITTGYGRVPMHSAWTCRQSDYTSDVRGWYCVVAGKNVYFSSIPNVTFGRVYASDGSFSSDRIFPADYSITPAGYGTAWYGDYNYNAQDYTVEPFNTIEEAAIAFLGGAPRKWSVRYIPINCSLTGLTSVDANTEMTVTVTPYPGGELIGASVYYSGGRIDYDMVGNTIVFTTPSFPN